MKERRTTPDETHITRLARILFARERVPTKLRVKAVLAYWNGMSFRRVARYFGNVFSPEAVRYWWHRLASALDYLRERSDLLVSDETRIPQGKKSTGESHAEWIGIDAHSMKIVHLELTRYQTNEACYDYLSALVHHAKKPNPLVIHDEGSWYKSQPAKLEIAHQSVVGGIRNRIESVNRQLKHRMHGFDTTWPRNAGPASIGSWIRAWAVVWNLRRGAQAP